MSPDYTDQIMPWVGRIERQFSILMKEALGPLDITYPEFRMVGILLEEDEGLSQKYLAARLGLDASGVSVSLKRLEKKEIVERVRDPDDARIVRVKCTPKVYGMTEILDAYRAQEVCASENLSPEDKAQLTRLLSVVSENLSQKTGVL